jgi:hypothetical protein
MPEISRFFGIVIQMYVGDHNPPHFHAVYAGQRAVFDIRTQEMIRGELPRHARANVVKWTRLHVDELLADWELAQRDELPLPIAPLE